MIIDAYSYLETPRPAAQQSAPAPKPAVRSADRLEGWFSDYRPLVHAARDDA